MMSRRLRLNGGYSGFTYVPPFSLEGPYDPARIVTDTLKTQVHCHTTQTDGSHTPATIVASYLSAGYDVLAITDHDKLTDQPAGIGLTIVGNELSPGAQHIISLDNSYLRGGSTAAQTLIDGALAAGGQAFVAHPKWSTGMTYAEMAALTGHLGLEIHNGKVVNGAGQNPVTYPGFAIDRWDQLLTDVNVATWGFSDDDLHTIGSFETYDLGSLYVFSEGPTVADVMTALVSGDFVASVSNQGVTPGYPVRTTADVSLTCAGATRIEAYGMGGVLLASADDDNLTYVIGGDERYIRLVGIGDYFEPFDALSDRWAAVNGTWTTPSGVLNLASTSTARIVLRRHRQGDFTARVDVKLGGSGSSDRAELMFNVLNSNYYYIVHVGNSGDAAFNDRLAIAVTTGNSFASGALASTPHTANAGTWYTIKMDYSGTTIRAKVWDRDGESEPADWMVTVSDASWGHGAFGFRAGGNAQFDNLYIDGFRTYYQPIAVAV